MGEHSLGTRNARGDILPQFCQEENLAMMNTWFRVPPRRLYIWMSRSPQDNEENCIRNHIDCLLINLRLRNAIKALLRLKTYSGASKASTRINQEMRRLTSEIKNTDNVDIMWSKIKNSNIKTQNESLQKKQKNRQPWMPQEILEIIEQKKYSNKNPEKYKEKIN